MNDVNVSFENLGFKIPPRNCRCRSLRRCPIYQMTMSGVKANLKQGISGMKTVHPLCLLCGFFCGTITDKRVKQLRMWLAVTPRRY